MHLISNRSRAARLTGLLAVGLAVLAPACGGGSSTTKVTSTTSTSTVKRSSTSTTAESPPSTKSGRADAVLAPPLLALFPFQTVAEVQAWQQEYRADGQPVQYPDPGSTITSPLPVGGEITGVDENIKIRVLQLHAISVLGEFCCVPAGSEPWSATVTFSVPTDPVLIVSASTGGHIRAVERFSVNGVKAG